MIGSKYHFGIVWVKNVQVPNDWDLVSREQKKYNMLEMINAFHTTRVQRTLTLENQKSSSEEASTAGSKRCSTEYRKA